MMTKVKVNLDIEDNLNIEIIKKTIGMAVTMKANLIKLIEKGKSIKGGEDI